MAYMRIVYKKWQAKFQNCKNINMFSCSCWYQTGNWKTCIIYSTCEPPLLLLYSSFHSFDSLGGIIKILGFILCGDMDDTPIRRIGAVMSTLQ